MTQTFLQGPRSRADIRRALRAWVLEHHPDLSADAIDDHTPLIEARYLESLDVAELLLFVEQLRSTPIDVEALTAGVFRDIETIANTFFAEAVR